MFRVALGQLFPLGDGGGGIVAGDHAEDGGMGGEGRGGDAGRVLMGFDPAQGLGRRVLRPVAEQAFEVVSAALPFWERQGQAEHAVEGASRLGSLIIHGSFQQRGAKVGIGDFFQPREGGGRVLAEPIYQELAQRGLTAEEAGGVEQGLGKGGAVGGFDRDVAQLHGIVPVQTFGLGEHPGDGGGGIAVGPGAQSVPKQPEAIAAGPPYQGSVGLHGGDGIVFREHVQDAGEKLPPEIVAAGVGERHRGGGIDFGEGG